jgi:hypothetical protein
MLFEIYVTRSYVVSEEARATVKAASKDEAVEAFWSDMDAFPWETTDQEPNQDTRIACKRVQNVRPDLRVVGGKLVAQES